MKNKQVRSVLVVPAVLSVAWGVLLGGCTRADPATLKAFVADLLKNATMAFLW